MNATTIEQELRQALTEACQKELGSIGLETDLVHELELDSMASLRLLAVVEKRRECRDLPRSELAAFGLSSTRVAVTAQSDWPRCRFEDTMSGSTVGMDLGWTGGGAFADGGIG